MKTTILTAAFAFSSITMLHAQKSNTDLILIDIQDFYLKSRDIKTLVICGMQTHMCVEAATRAGSDLGFKCILIHDACATRDLKFNDKIIKAEDVHYSTLSALKNYASVVSADEFLATFK